MNAPLDNNLNNTTCAELLSVKNLSVSFGNKTILDDICFDLKPGEQLVIVGPNGAGKSTLVAAISAEVAHSGTITFAGKDVAKLKSKQRAKLMGVMAQKFFVEFAFTVKEVVSLGRYAHSAGPFTSLTDADEQLLNSAITRCGLDEMLDRSILALSGGELQRTFLAQVFAQNPQVLILDEPTNHLDLKFQKRIFELLEQWRAEDEQRATICVSHDLNFAHKYASRVMLLDEGRVVALGKASEVLSPSNLACVYDLDVHEWMRSLLAAWQA